MRSVNIHDDDDEVIFRYPNARVYAVIISEYATKIIGTQDRQVACVHGMQDHMQSIFQIWIWIVTSQGPSAYR